jgi:hypothetical protein
MNLPEPPIDKPLPLLDKVQQWLETEGYPLEFQVADAFRRAGFDASQGLYVKDQSSDEAREIDVLADMTADISEDKWFRVSQMVECKWSKDKPWVIFTSPETRMAESACIAQAIGSSLGEAAMFCLAGDGDLHPSELFKCPERGGFAGRRAFEKQEKDKFDEFYRAIQGLVANAASRAKSYDKHIDQSNDAPHNGLIVFPILVVDGNLFEGFYDGKTGGVVVKEANHIRMLWRGSTANRRAITPVDIVTAASIDTFALNRAAEVKLLLDAIGRSVVNIEEAFLEMSFEKLVVIPASRGYRGLPPLLARLYQLDQARNNDLGLHK